jgi:hypothetical protein
MAETTNIVPKLKAEPQATAPSCVSSPDALIPSPRIPSSGEVYALGPLTLPFVLRPGAIGPRTTGTKGT